MDDLETALEYLNNAIKFDPEFYEAYITRGKIHSMLMEWEKAMADFSKALDMNPESVEARMFLNMADNIQDKYRQLLKDREEFNIGKLSFK